MARMMEPIKSVSVTLDGTLTTIITRDSFTNVEVRRRKMTLLLLEIIRQPRNLRSSCMERLDFVP